MRTVYSIQFKTTSAVQQSASDVFEDIRARMALWIRDKYSREWSTAVDLPDATATLAPMDGHQIVLRRETCDDVELLSLDWSHPDSYDSASSWINSCVLARSGGELQVEFHVRVAALESILRPTRFNLGRPGFITTLLRDFDNQIGEWGIPKHVERLSASSVDGFVQDALLSPKRTLPVVMISPDVWDGRFYVDADSLFRSLAGFAHVVVLADKWAAFKLTDAIGKSFSTYNGAVRIYWPRFSPTDNPFWHRLYLARVLRYRESDGVPLAKHLFRVLAAISTFRFVEGSVIHDARKAIVDDEQSQVEKLKQSVREGTVERKDLEEELLEALVRVDDLRGERDRLKEELESQKAAWGEYQNFMSADEAIDQAVDTTDDQPGFGNVTHALRQAETDFSGPLVFLPSAHRSASESPFKNADRVYELLEALHLVASEWKEQAGSLGQSWNEALAVLGFDCRDQVSQTSRGKWRAVYSFTYKGEERLFERHITIGAKQADTCLSVHWYRDDDDLVLVIGHCGRHLRNTKT